MKSSVHSVYVTILVKEYQVACKPEEKHALLLAAKDLDARMRQVRNAGTVVGVDRIAVMVALNLCHELQSRQEQVDAFPETHAGRMLEKLERALDSTPENSSTK